MAKQGGEKCTFVIKEDSFWEAETCSSGTFDISDCSCNLSADFNEYYPDSLTVNLRIFYSELSAERRKCVKYRLTILNQFSEDLSISKGGLHWFDSLTYELNVKSEFFILNLLDEYVGFLVNEEVKIVVEVDVLEVIDKINIPEEFRKTTRPPSKINENNSAGSTVLLKKASTIKKGIDVNGFQVFPSQVESVRRIFEKHPNIAVGFRSENQHLRNSCMFSLLSIIETLCQPLEELSDEDLAETDIALTYVKDSGFKVDWLEKKLNKVKENKEKELSGLAILQETKECLLELEQKCSELEEELSATRTPLSFDDVPLA